MVLKSKIYRGVLMKLEFLKDSSPYSTMRVSVFLFNVLFIPSFVFIWVWASLQIKALAIVPDSVIWILGTVLGAKTAQKVVEVTGKIFGKPDEPTNPAS